MNYRIVTCGNIQYIECLPGLGSDQVKGENDALDWVALCGGESIHRLLIHADNLTPEFYQLKTGVAGAVLQKFVNYAVRVAALLSPELVNQGRFYDMVIEANRGNHFRVFYTRPEAESWLVMD